MGKFGALVIVGFWQRWISNMVIGSRRKLVSALLATVLIVVVGVVCQAGIVNSLESSPYISQLLLQVEDVWSCSEMASNQNGHIPDDPEKSPIDELIRTLALIGMCVPEGSGVSGFGAMLLSQSHVNFVVADTVQSFCVPPLLRAQYVFADSRPAVPLAPMSEILRPA